MKKEVDQITSDKVNKENISTPKNKNNKFIIGIFIILLILGLTLPFHYAPGYFMMFPKDELSMKHTFIWGSDLDFYIAEFNRLDNRDQKAFMADPFIQKLFDHGLLIHQKDTTNRYINMGSFLMKNPDYKGDTTKN